MQSPIYWHPFLYQNAIMITYGKRLKARYLNLEKHLPGNSNVLELCMGDAFFYRKYLAQKKINYQCCDINPVFVKAAKSKGLTSFLTDISRDEIPKADYVLMQGSLCYFIPNQIKIIQKLLDACNKEVIISENIESISNSKSRLKSFLAEQFSKAKTGQSKIKFTKESLYETFSGFKSHLKVWEESPDSKEIIIVLNK
jgi:hypothetical protein